MTKSEAPQEISPLHMRKAMSRFVSGVTVITSVENEETTSVHGMTANSFTSVSLDPPLVLVSVGKHARMHDRIADSGRYGVSILADRQSHLSTHFAGRPGESPPEFVWRDGVPLLDGALAQVVCSLEAAHPAGDHTLFVGRVNHLWYDNGNPLVFYTGSYRDLRLIDREDVWGL